MIEKKCSICGQISEYNETFDFSKMKDADLGGMPKFGEGQSFENMVERCPFCGYCNFDIEKNVLTANKLLQSEGYQYIINSGDMPTAIANMAGVAYIYECQNVLYVSARAHGFASKMLEDIGEGERSQMFKEQEARLLLLHIQTEYFKKHFDIKVYQYLIDALRRLKKFDKAIQFCEVALSKTYASVQRNIFHLEKSLCMNFISEPHEFGDKNGEFNNFYQILIGAFGSKQSVDVYKDLYDKTHAYLEKCVYFPIADGADFIIKIDKAENASMDEMIVKLRATYDEVRGVAKENGENDTAKNSDIQAKAEEAVAEKKELNVYPQIKKQPKILTLQSIEEEKDAVEKYEKLKTAHEALEKENEEVLSALVLAKNECEDLTHSVNILHGEVEKAEEKLKIANEELQNKEAILLNKNAIILEKDEMLERKEELLKASENMLSEREIAIADLKKQLVICENQISRLKNDDANLQIQLEEEIELLREGNAKSDLDIYKLQQEISSLKIENARLKEDTLAISNSQSKEELSSFSPFESKFEESREVESKEETEEAEDAEYDFFADDELSETEETAITEDLTNEEYEEEDFSEIEFPDEEEISNSRKELENATEEDVLDGELESDFDGEYNEYTNEFMGEDEDMAEFVLDDITEDMILSIAKISGQIDVSEVQGMLLVGYKNAKFALDKIAGDGKLSETEEDVYKYIEV